MVSQECQQGGGGCRERDRENERGEREGRGEGGVSEGERDDKVSMRKGPETTT